MANRAAFTGCYDTLEEFANCVDPTPLGPGQRSKIYKAQLFWIKRGEHRKDVEFNCKEMCRGLVEGDMGGYVYVQHLRFNYGAFCESSFCVFVFVYVSVHQFGMWVHSMHGFMRMRVLYGAYSFLTHWQVVNLQLVLSIVFASVVDCTHVCLMHGFVTIICMMKCFKCRPITHL